MSENTKSPAASSTSSSASVPVAPLKSKSTGELYKWALQLAIPLMIQNLISSLVNTADTVMLGYVGQSAMAASSLANQYTFVLHCFFFGMATATSVMCAQYWGKKDSKTIERVVGLAARVSLIFSIVFTALSFFFPEIIMKLFTDSPETITIGAQYLKVMSISFIFMAISQVYTSALRSIGKVTFPSVVAIVSLCVNIILNATFIFGLFGMQKMGVTGVALGTVIARLSEVILCLVYSFRCEIKFRIKYIFSRAGILTKDFIKICLPSIGNDLVWSLATTVFTIILGHMGDDIVAANAVAVMVVDIGAIAERGFANATTIVIGQTLGANLINQTKEYSAKLIRLTGYVAAAGCIVIIALRPLIMRFYSDKLSEQAIYYLGIMMFMTTYRMIGEGINTCLICGCFRGGGDTKYGLFMDIVMMWLVSIPLMAIAAYVIKLPPIGVYFVMTLDELIKMPFIFIHYKKYTWMKNITRDEAELRAN